MLRKYFVLSGLLFLIFFPGIIGLSPGYHGAEIPISPVADNLSEDGEDTTSKLLIDSVYLFEPFQTVELIPLNMTKDTIYYFSFESYVPYDPSFFIDVRMESPSGLQYYFFEEDTSIHLNETYWYFEYGAAETGEHILKIIIETEANLTLHILVKETVDLQTYYNRNQFDSIIPGNISIAEIRQYGQIYLSTEYTFPMLDDTEYFFNFFRVNMLSYEARQFIDYVNPTVKLGLVLNGTPFVLYPEIQTQNYSLSTNVAHMGEVELYNWETEVFLPDLLDHPLFHISFGSFTTGNATLTLTFDYLWNPLLFNMNFAFMVYAIGNGEIGDGPDDDGNASLPPADTPPSNDDLLNESTDDVSALDRIIISVQIFFLRYFDQALFIVGGLLVISVAVGKLWTAPRMQTDTKGKNKAKSEIERPSGDD